MVILMFLTDDRDVSVNYHFDNECIMHTILGAIGILEQMFDLYLYLDLLG